MILKQIVGQVARSCLKPAPTSCQAETEAHVCHCMPAYINISSYCTPNLSTIYLYTTTCLPIGVYKLVDFDIGANHFVNSDSNLKPIRQTGTPNYRRFSPKSVQVLPCRQCALLNVLSLLDTYKHANVSLKNLD